MRYLYHFEFCERPEMPEWLRGDLFLSLAWLQNVFGLKHVLSSVVPELIGVSGARRLIELGSGSGDGLAYVAEAILHEPDRAALPMIATDKYPHPAIWKKRLARFASVSWRNDSVGFEDFDQALEPRMLSGSIILLVSAFHHVSSEHARDFLERAARTGASVLVVEPLDRNLKGVFLGGVLFLPALLFPLRALLRSWPGLGRWMRLAVFHWGMPLIPFFLSHDGIISARRQRTSDDWDGLIEGLPYERIVRSRLGLMRNFSAVLLKMSEKSRSSSLR